MPYLARFNANTNFAPEQLNGYELGYRRLLGNKALRRCRELLQPLSRSVRRGIHGPVFLEDNPAPPHYLLPAQFGNGLLGYTKGVEIAPGVAADRAAGGCADPIPTCT